MFNSHFDLDEIDVSNFPEILQKLYAKTIKECDSVFLLDTSSTTIQKNEKILGTAKKISYLLEQFHRNINKMILNLEDNLEGMISDLSADSKPEFVHHTFAGMLSFPGREKVAKPEKMSVVQPVQEKPMPMLVPQLNCRITLNKVNKLSAIPPAFYWFVGSPENEPGIYVNLAGQYIKVPFPKLMDPQEYDKARTIRCKYGSKLECTKKHMNMSKMYRSAVRQCNYAHQDDQMVKLCYPVRCPNRPLFGDPANLRDDVNYIYLSDIKNLLLYGLHDLFMAGVWFDYQLSRNISYGVIDDLENA